MRRSFVVTFCLSLLSVSLQASPWIEADDPFLRSDLQQLADSGLIRLPLNSFPLRWSLLADQFSRIDPETLNAAQLQAYRNVQYRLDSERLGRGRSHLTLGWGSEGQAGLNGFGDALRSKYLITASHEEVGNGYAVRLSGGYRQSDDGSDRWHYDGSYAAVGWQDFSVSIGALDHWWGPGWQQALAFGEQAKPLPAIALSYQNPAVGHVGSLFVETLLGKQDNDVEADKLWASRLAWRPLTWVQLGSSYKHWLGGDDRLKGQTGTDSGNGTWSADLRLASPLPAQGTGGLYGEVMADRQTEQRYRLVGVDAAWLLAGQSLRLVVEQQQSSGDDQVQPLWQHYDASISDAVLGKRFSTGGYLNFNGGQTLSLFWHHTSPADSDAYDAQVMQFALPMLAGRVTTNLTHQNSDSSTLNRWYGGVVYEFRFY